MSNKKEIIKHLHNVTLGGHPIPARNQSEALKKFEIELYTRKERLVFELIQNADDFPSEKLGVVDLKFTFLNENILVTHNGKEFQDIDVKAISSIGNSAKSEDESATGYKGIGFKSVFTHSKKVFISSGGYLFRYDKSYEKYLKFEELYPSLDVQDEFKGEFEKHATPDMIPWELMPIWTEQNEFPNEVKNIPNLFDFPVAFVLSFGKENVEEFKPKIAKLFQEPRFLLFLRNINSIRIDGLEENIVVVREKEKSFCHLKVNEKNSETFLTLEKPIKIEIGKEDIENLKKVDDIPPKLLDVASFSLNFAIGFEKDKLIPVENSVIFTYLPTEDKTYKFPFLVNSDFVTSSNREVILPDNKWNKFVFEHIGYELFNWIKSIVESNEDYRFSFTVVIPEKFKIENNDTDSIEYHFNKGFDKAIQEIAFLPTSDGNFCRFSEGIIDLIGFSDIIGHDIFLSIIDSKKKLIDNRVENKGRILFNDIDTFWLDDLKKIFVNEKFKEILNPTLLLKILKFISGNKYLQDKFIEVTLLLADNDNKDLLLTSNIYFQTNEENRKLLTFKDVNFLHPVINDFAEINLEFKEWLKNLGVREFQGEIFIRDEVIDKQNLVNQSLNKHFNNKNFWTFVFLYHKNLSEIELKKLQNFYLIDESKNKHGIASSFYLSDYFSKKGEPSIEDIFEELELEGLFVRKGYYQDNQPASWHTFFSKIGVKKSEGITIFKDKIIPFIQNEKMTEENYLKITKFVFEVFHSNKNIFTGINLSNFKVLTTDNELKNIYSCILSDEYTIDKRLNSVLTEYQLSNQINNIYLKEISNNKQKWKEFFLFLNKGIELSSIDIMKKKIEIIAKDSSKVTTENVLDVWKTIFEFKDELLKTHKEQLKKVPVLSDNNLLIDCCSGFYFPNKYNPRTNLEELLKGYYSRFISSKYISISDKDLKPFFKELGVDEVLRGFTNMSLYNPHSGNLRKYQFCANFWNYFIDNFNLIDLQKSQIFLNGKIPLPCLDGTVKDNTEVYSFELKDLLKDKSITCSIKFTNKIEETLGIRKVVSLSKCLEILNIIAIESNSTDKRLSQIYNHLLQNFINKTFINTEEIEKFKQNGKLLTNSDSFENVTNLYFQDSSTYHLPLDNNSKIVQRISNREKWEKFENVLSKLGVQRITEEDFVIDTNNSKSLAQELHKILELSIAKIAAKIEITNQKSLESKMNNKLEKLKIYFVNKLFLDCKKLNYRIEIPNYYDKSNVIYYAGEWDSISNAKIIDYLFQFFSISEKHISKDEFINILLSQRLVQESTIEVVQKEGIQEIYERSSNYQSGKYVNKTVARYGEEFVNKELNKYFKNRVKWLNENGEAGNPYDFIIYTDETKSQMLFYVDAKSTSTGEDFSNSIPFFIMQSEWNLIKRGNSKYVVARVFNATSSNPSVEYVDLKTEKF
ncbi:sacsin N-terminal ATP-binding-like domain-containing protein [Bernardetia sp. OM2101]|uniref:sacsin N-terminal ATP-binding-like domain-containing protein n=1 Tax=Bernardetia sp. OM2101 TaxID=3344876 RepID=UPI0035D13531